MCTDCLFLIGLQSLNAEFLNSLFPHSSLSGGRTMSSLCRLSVVRMVNLLRQLGLLFHWMKMRQTGTAVRIMASPIPVSTGCAIMGRRVMTRVMLRYTMGKARLILMGRASSGCFQRRQGRQKTAAPMDSQVVKPRQFIRTLILLTNNKYK